MSPIESEIQQKFDEHEKVLDRHGQEIEKIKDTQTKMLVQYAEMNTKLSSIEAAQYDIKKSIAENSLAQRSFEKELIAKFIEKDTERDRQDVEMNKFNMQKFTDIFLKVLGLLAILYAGKEVILK